MAIAAQAQPTNWLLYNFDTDQVTQTPYGDVWRNWFGGNFVSVEWDPSNDASNNPNSGSMKLTIDNKGYDQYVLHDGFANANPWTPTYAPVPLHTFTNLSFDMRYDITSAIRTNTAPAGVNGSLGPGSLDFGFMRVGTIGGVPGAVTWGQNWYHYWAISATNGAGQPNTNWIRVNVDLRGVAGMFGDLQGGLNNIMFALDNGAYGNQPLVGQQIIWFDNIQFTGTMPQFPPPTLSIEKPYPPALWLFGGSGIHGRSQVALQGDTATWVDGPFPVTYSFKILDNATEPGGLDTHIHFIGGGGDASYFDWGRPNVLWLQIISGSGTNTTCVANISWKTNAPGSNPDEHNVALRITNSQLAGKWTLTFLSITNGTLTAPGAGPVPFSINLPEEDVVAAFSAPISVRFGHQNNGNAAHGGVPHYWAEIAVSNANGPLVYEDFTKAGTNQLDTTIWNLNTSDGVGVIQLVPTNAHYWIKWNTPDTGFVLVTATNLNGPWLLPQFYNNYADGTYTVANQTHQRGQRWNLMMPYYLPTANGQPGGPLSPYAYFRLTTNPPEP